MKLVDYSPYRHGGEYPDHGFLIYVGIRGYHTARDTKFPLLVLGLHHLSARHYHSRGPRHIFEITYYPMVFRGRHRPYLNRHEFKTGPFYLSWLFRGASRELILSFSRHLRPEWQIPVLERVRILSQK